ncbi:cell wall protein [Paraburkholderia fungorum]|uniref:LamG-like jellyroll fold domain-containing protein n=1 Tax=Paraburkholderia fungorum TaxID=134537 RepID=UPI0038B8AE00
MSTKNRNSQQRVELDDLASVPEIKRRQLLRMMLASSAAGISGVLGGCGGGGVSSDTPSNSGSPRTSASPGTANVPGAGIVPGTGNAPGTGPTPHLVSSFTLATLPDTQFYPRYASEKMGELYQKNYPSINPQYDNPFKTQTQWIAQHANALKLAFTAHLGDVVDQSWYYSSEASSPWASSTDLVSNGQLSNGAITKEWELASQAMQVLEKAKCNYSICAGNHDVGAIGTSMQWGPDWGVGVTGFDNTDGYQDGGSHRQGLLEPFLQVFPPARAQQQATFMGRHSSGFHEYHLFVAEGNQILVLSMSWRASDDAISWANWVIGKNPGVPAILISHQLAGIGTDGVTAADTAYSNYLWDHLINNNDQIFMAVSGHYHGSCQMTKKNAAGNDVIIMVVDYQMAYMGGNGLMRLYEFDLTNNKIIASSFSPWVPLKPESSLNEFDSAWLTADNQNFSIDLDFSRRFAGFNPGFKAAAGSVSGSLTDVAKGLILANYNNPPQAPGKPASGPNDYPVVANTLAHWRFYNSSAADGAALSPYQPGFQLKDVSVPGDTSVGANPISLNTWMGGQPGDLVWSTDHHPLSSAPGSLQFKNSTQTRASYFTTDSNSPLNVQTFGSGYTIEAFVKIDPAWTAQNNSWMGILYRLGARSAATNVTWASGVDQGDTMMMFAFSNLMEFQWEVVPTDNNINLACWSGGVSAGQWLHVAIVNDGKGNTTMYVEGAPILRNNSGMDGIRFVASNQQMAVGASQYGGSMGNGFFGSIGEIRIVGMPLQSNQWLTARAS